MLKIRRHTLICSAVLEAPPSPNPLFALITANDLLLGAKVELPLFKNE
jgi:hypothetical protein